MTTNVHLLYVWYNSSPTVPGVEASLDYSVIEYGLYGFNTRSPPSKAQTQYALSHVAGQHLIRYRGSSFHNRVRGQNRASFKRQVLTCYQQEHSRGTVDAHGLNKQKLF